MMMIFDIFIIYAGPCKNLLKEALTRPFCKKVGRTGNKTREQEYIYGHGHKLLTI